ncbi:TOM1-like protein 5 isoform X2 [Cornus florida]|uniref:TOM1-like protein 5 isoform X2 n=1 Tax=Cornus florida TaxID=4283 RepID=UPI00289ACE91|nr:TOM1-like protein 5 isoform X2 [Cornus florida]
MKKMASELVNSATSEKLTEMDWMKNIEICELVSLDQRQARDVIKAIKKRMGSKNSNTQLFAVTLLEMLMNNIGEHIHRQVIDAGLLPILVKIVKKKTEMPVREKIFLLLDATQTSLGGASGKFPEYYTAYYDLVSAGVQFPQRPHVIPFNHSTSNSNKNQPPSGEIASSGHERVPPQAESKVVAESSVIQKAGTALQVLREVLDAVDAQHPEGAKDEFTLDLVEQCSFQKQQLMQLVMTSRDEKVISRAIDLNEELHKVLSRHNALVFGRSTSTSNHFNPEVEEEEDAEQLLRRIRKGKACARPEDEERQIEKPFGLPGSPVPGESLNRPHIRPLSLEPSQELNTLPPAVAIPPPPAKHVERKKFFQENKLNDSVVSGHMRGLSLHSRNASSSHSGSMDSSD